MKKNLLIAAALLIGMAASAQSFVSIPLSKDTFKASHLTPLPKGNYQGMDIYKTLHDNNAYPVLQACNGLIFTGPTGTNVNDVAVVLIRRRQDGAKER